MKGSVVVERGWGNEGAVRGCEVWGSQDWG